MPAVDLIILALIAAVAVWGYREGFNARALALFGFGVGAIVGSRVAPLVLDGGLEDKFAPLVALPAALLFGAIFGTVFERLGFGLRRRVRARGTANAVGGAALAACVGLVGVWILAAVAARVDDVRGDVRDSEVIERLNAVLPPPGPLLRADEKPRFDPLPIITGPRPNLGPADPKIVRDRQVRAAAASVVKVHVLANCEGGGRGSGWIARDGIVVTNAHVVEKAQALGVQLRGKGALYVGRVIWFDERNDIAVIRVPGVSGKPALRLGRDPKPGTHAAALGFPGGGPYRVHAARSGQPRRDPGFRTGPKEPRRKANITPFRSIGPTKGSSGGPYVDRRGHVRGMHFAGIPDPDPERYGDSSVGWGVPMGGIRRALKRAGTPVPFANCLD